MEQFARRLNYKALVTTPTAPQSDHLFYNKLGFTMIAEVLFEEIYIADLAMKNSELNNLWIKTKPKISMGIKYLN